MKTSKILERLLESEPGAVVVEECSKKFILWTLSNSFRKERILKELRTNFPSLEKQDLLLKLGTYPLLSTANKFVANARYNSSSSSIRQLFLLPLVKKKIPRPRRLLVRQSKRRVITT